MPEIAAEDFLDPLIFQWAEEDYIVSEAIKEFVDSFGDPS